MNSALNKLAFSILERLAVKYPFIERHIPFLKINTVEYTGVGMYINFGYNNPNSPELDFGIKDQNLSISTNETIEMDGLKYGLTYEVDITEGQIKFIELVTNGEDWDGKIPDKFTFME